LYKTLWDTIRAGRIWRGELVNRRKDGTLYTEQMSITPVRDADDSIIQYIAIIALTASAMEEDRKRCIESGMDGYVTKPIRVNKLFAEADRILSMIKGPYPEACCSTSN